MIEVAPPSHGYEEGLEQGKKVNGSYRMPPTSRVENWLEAFAEAPKSLSGPRREEDVLVDLQKLTHGDLLAHAADLHEAKMRAFPDLKKFPELAGYDQYIDEKALGYADGAGIDVRQVHLDNYWKEIFFHVCGGGTINIENCSEYWFPNTPDGPLLGKGWDDTYCWYKDNPFPLPPDNPPDPFVHEIPPAEEGKGYRVSATGSEVGLCIDQGGGALYEFEENREGAVFPAPVNTLVLQRCDTVFEAVEMMTRYKDFWGPCNLVVGDRSGNAALFEKSKFNYAVRMTTRNVLITTYGGCDDEDMRAMCDMSNPIFKYYERRLYVMNNIVAEAETNGGLNLEVYWKSILHHDSAAPGCTHRETKPDGVELFTMGASAILPRDGRRLSRTIARVKGGFRYACETPAVESRFRFA